MVLLEFCKDSGFCSDKDAQDTYNRFHIQLNELVRAQEKRFRESMEAKTVDYLALIRDLYRRGSFRIAKDAEGFNPDKHDGIIYYGCLCLRGKRLNKKLQNVCQDLSLDDCIAFLLNKNALKLVESKNTVQINSTGGKRFYAIWLKN